MDVDTKARGGAASGPPLLERILSLDALRWAWHRVRENRGKPGPDGVTLGRFAHLLDANLLALADEVRAGTYRPGPYRRLTVRSHCKARLIGIAPVRDRVLQRATLDALTPIVEPTFLPCSFGYRPLHSLQGAVERIVRLRERGLWWVVDADITACFASLDHALLSRFLEPLVPDLAVRRLLVGWMAASSGAAPNGTGRGVPLGSVVSPLFCNVYLHHLDVGLRRRRLQLVRYADDFVVLCKSREHAQWALRGVEKILSGLGLDLNRRKTRVVSFDDGFDFLGVRFERTDYTYLCAGKRVRVDTLPPAWFHYHADGYA